jgi:hypothetical protein
MRHLPPRIVRRVLLAPAAILFLLIVLAISPVLLLAAFVIDVIRRWQWRVLRLVTFAVVYVLHELVAILVLFVLWIVSGFGVWMRTEWMEAAHYGFARRWLRSLYLAAGALLRLRIDVVEGPEPRPGPLLVFGRHGGIGNSLMYAGVLMARYRRRPRVVMLYLLQWDPVVDMLGHRMPSLFIDHDPTKSDGHVDAIARLASGMRDMDAFIIFPEGHDFTPKLRLRAIGHLRKKGRLEEAARAEDMKNVLPPRHRGAQAAMVAAPNADVAFVAHTVLEDVGSFADIWHRLPLKQPIRACYWRVDAEDLPHGDADVIAWLYSWWERIDAWIADCKAEEALESGRAGTR